VQYYKTYIFTLISFIFILIFMKFYFVRNCLFQYIITWTKENKLNLKQSSSSSSFQKITPPLYFYCYQESPYFITVSEEIRLWFFIITIDFIDDPEYTLLYIIIHQDNPRMMTNISWKYNGTAIIILRVSV
jgi:hypothetical protein